MLAPILLVGYVVIDASLSANQTAEVREQLAAIPGTLKTRVLY